MTKVVFIEHSGVEHPCDGEISKSLMQIAIENGVPGILADCGGSATCGTCQGFVDSRWAGRLRTPNEQEATVLDGLMETQATSRLTCQVIMSAELDGIVVRLPASQI